MALLNFRAPPLPLASRDYDKPYFDQFVRVLNIIFSQINSTNPIQADYFIGRGTSLLNSHIAASDSTDQYATATNTPTVVAFNTLDSGFGWDLNPPGSATALYAGVYTIRYSLQFANNDSGQHTVVCWLKKDGTDVANSATSFSIPGRKNPATPGFICAYSEATFTVEEGDVISLYWATDQAATSGGTAGVYIFHDAAQTSPYARPAIPSALGSITFVSAPLPLA